MKFFNLIIILSVISIGCKKSSTNYGIAGEVTEQIDGKYIFENILIETRDGAKISGIVARSSTQPYTPQPTIFQFTIYVRDKGRDIETLKESVDRGYVGVIAYTRGKRYSPGNVFPYEYDGSDAFDVIDWISQQEWSDGTIGMYGGSYNGFTQWAACKELHPSLKTIVPYVANRPGMGLPMENNIFINPNYEWSFYVGNNNYLDTIAGNDRQRFRNMQNEWWESGVAYSKMDSIDGVPNRLFQRWLSHPSFDEYWQKMAPYKEEFSKIDIPVLSIDGYYNDSQNSGLYYLREHYKYFSNPEHYLIIGPYSHFGAQNSGEKIINGYRVDEDALINTNEITYQWFDYILKGGNRPERLKDKINYQIMGANQWGSAPTIEKMSNENLKMYLSNHNYGEFKHLISEIDLPVKTLWQEVDFSNRDIWNNNYYPDPIVQDEIGGTGYYFISDPFKDSLIINGSFSGELFVTINKKDFDFGVTLYEVTPKGEYFHLSYIVSRASYEKDITERNLLQPNQVERINFDNTHLVSKKLSPGSRLLVYVDVNKNPFSELNYGTGGIVSEETIENSEEPLVVKWHTNSSITIPILR